MAYKNFIPTVWAEQINRELERNHVYVQDTNRQYEGNVQKMGDSVRILGVGKPTITTQIGGDVELNAPETAKDSSVTMLIDHVSHFNYMIDDIDKRQAVGGVMDALSKESSEALANEQDMAVSNLSLDPLVKVADEAPTAITKDNILNYIDNGLVYLYGNDVKPDGFISITVPPWFYMLLKQAYTALDTDNSKMLENGKVGRYGNVIVRMSNNVAKKTYGSGASAEEADMIQLKTNRAFAFANPMTHTEPYRPESRFSDAVKGFVLYGTKVVRPKEAIILNCYDGSNA